jgi:5-methylcytosine-specific restriction endonuclease McrA
MPKRIPAVPRDCLHCGKLAAYSGRGRPPTYCDDCRHLVQRLWYKRNKASVLAYNQSRRLPGSRAEESRRYRERHRERLNEQSRLWRQANPEKRRERSRRGARMRRARLRQALVVPFAPEQLQQRLSMFPGCWLCGGPKDEVDHVKPLSKGGAHALANLRPICAPCNREKGTCWPFAPAFPATYAWTSSFSLDRGQLRPR